MYRLVVATFVLCITLISSIIIFASIPPAWLQEEPQEIPFEVVAEGRNCGITEETNLSISESDSWQDLWIEVKSRYTPMSELPVVNFTTDIIFAVFMGNRSTGGYRIYISRIILTSIGYIIYFVKEEPADDLLEYLHSQPFCIVKISGYSLDIPALFFESSTTLNRVIKYFSSETKREGLDTSVYVVFQKANSILS